MVYNDLRVSQLTYYGEKRFQSNLDHNKKEYETTKEQLDNVQNEFDCMKHVTDQLCSMLNVEEYSDFTFTVSGKTYFVHKVVLASHSPVFAALFRSNMEESKTNNALIDDCDSDVFEVLLKYLYTGGLSRVKKMAEQLLPLSEKYQITSLKTICENNIEIENKNAINLMIIAEKYSANILKSRAIDHIKSNLHSIRSEFATEIKQLITDYPDLVFNIFEKL